MFNPSIYPNFLRFLKPHPKIAILNTEMTFSVSRDTNGLFERAGDNLMTIFVQSSRLLDQNMGRLVYDVLRFNACARKLIIGWNIDKDEDAGCDDLSIGQYLEREGYSDAFHDNYLIVGDAKVLKFPAYPDEARQPITAAIWNPPPDKCAMDFPARTLVRLLLPLIHSPHLGSIRRYNFSVTTISLQERDAKINTRKKAD